MTEERLAQIEATFQAHAYGPHYQHGMELVAEVRRLHAENAELVDIAAELGATRFIEVCGDPSRGVYMGDPLSAAIGAGSEGDQEGV